MGRGDGICGSCSARKAVCECITEEPRSGAESGAQEAVTSARPTIDSANGECPAVTERDGLTYEGLRSMVEALAPLAELDAIAGLRGRSRDPREHPSSRGEQRDAAEALDAAHDHNALAAGRRAWARYSQLSVEAQETARWVALVGAALPRGQCPSVEEFSRLCGRLQGPVRLREREEETRERAAACALSVRVTQQRIAREGMTAEAALLLGAARSASGLMEHAKDVAAAEVLAWGRGRLERLAHQWAEVSG